MIIERRLGDPIEDGNYHYHMLVLHCCCVSVVAVTAEKKYSCKQSCDNSKKNRHRKPLTAIAPLYYYYC